MGTEIVVAVEAADLCAASELAPLDTNPAAIYLGSLGSEVSRDTMLAALAQAAAFFSGTDLAQVADRKRFVFAFPWHMLRYQHVQKLRADMGARYAPATINKTLAAVKRVAVECRRLGTMSADDAAAIGQDVPPARGSRTHRGRALSAIEVQSLREACAASAAGERNRFLLELLLATGIRRAEAASLTLGSLRVDAKELTVMGKGNKQRMVPMSGSLCDALARWLQTRGTTPGPLLCKSTTSGTLLLGKRMTGGAVFSLMRRLASRAGVAGLGPHDFRRTFASTLMDKGVDIKTVSRLLGHSSVTTTEKYDRRPERAMREAVEKLGM